MSNLDYKGYIGSVEHDLDDEYLHGKVLFVDDCIIYHGESVAELKQSFQNAIDEYLELCQEIGKDPEKTYSGTFNIRVTPELHRQCVKLAYIQNITLNQLVCKSLEQYCETHHMMDKLSQVNTALNVLNDSLTYYFTSTVTPTQGVFSYHNQPITEFYQLNMGRYC